MSEDILAVDTEPVKTAQTTAPATEPTGWMSPTGEIREGAPEAVANVVKNKGWDTVEKIVEGFVGLEQFKGAGKHLVIPEAEDAEGWDDVYKECGWPETYDKYEFSTESEVPISEELIDNFKQFAHKEHYTQKQLAGAIQFQLDAVEKMVEIENAQKAELQEQNVEALKLKFGTNGIPCSEEVYNAKVVGARIIADSLGIYKTLKAKGLASEASIIEMLDTIASRTTEDVITPTPPAPPAKTALEERDELNKSDAFLQKFHRDHRKAVARNMELSQIIANQGQAQQPRR